MKQKKIFFLFYFLSNREFSHYFIYFYLETIANFCSWHEDDKTFDSGNAVSFFCNVGYRYIICCSDFYRSIFFLIFTQNYTSFDYRLFRQQ